MSFARADSRLRSIAVLGASGQVGRALVRQLGAHRAIALTRLHGDLAKPNRLLSFLEEARPAALINASAYTAVDRAETEPDLAEAVNVEAPAVLADWCRFRGVPFVHYSTDYVFPGTGEQAWKEEDPTEPLNVYGRTKLEGEKAVVKSGGRFLIFRTSWVYDEQGKNFLRTMLRLGREREELQVVSDQIGAPTYAAHLAEASLTALQNALDVEKNTGGFPSGIYHLCNSGETSWHGFAEAIFEESRRMGIPLAVKTVKAIPSSQYPTPAKRPGNSRLSTEKAREILRVTLPDWRVGLSECLTRMEEER